MPATMVGQILTFQEGVNGYTGTLDTQLRQASPNANAGAAVSLITDQQDGTPPGVAQILLRFDNIIGAGPGQIPPGSLIRHAQLILYSSAGDSQSGDTISLHRLLQDWTEACTWNSCFGGDSVQVDDVEASVAPDATMIPNFPNPAMSGRQSRTNNVTAAVQAWANGQANYGWVLINSATDGYRIDSSEHGTVANRPLLRIEAGPCVPATFTQQPPANPSVQQCRTVSISAAVNGSAPITVQWSKDGVPIDPLLNPTANSPTLVISNAQAGDVGSYTLYAVNECNDATSAAAVLTVDPDDNPPVLTYAFGAPDNTTITLAFNEPMGPSAADNSNYTICKRDNPADCLPVTSATLSPDFTSVTLTVTGLTPGVRCEVVVQDVVDRCNDNPIAPNSRIPLSREYPLLQVNEMTLWKYNHEGVDLGTAWRAPAYDDSSWSNGLAALGVEDTPPADPPLRTPMVLTNANFPSAHIPTYYFRAHFDFPGNPAARSSRLKLLTSFDDFGYVYINGMEVYRDGNLGAVGSPELPFASYGGPCICLPPFWAYRYIPLNSTVQGDNVIAVQLKQQSPGSSDIYMALELVAELADEIVGPCASITDQPDSVTAAELQPVVFSVRTTGAGLQYEWQKDGRPIPGATSPTYTIVAARPSDTGAYRVRVLSDFCGDSLLSDVAMLTVIPKPSQPGAIYALGLAGETNILISFTNGPLNAVSAQNPTNYSVPGLTVQSAVLQPNGRDVLLTTTPRIIGQNYSLTVKDVTDAAQTPNVIYPNPTVINPLPQTVRLINWHHPWKFDTNCQTDVAWTTPGYDDSFWVSGLAPIGAEGGGATLAFITNTTGNGIMTPILAPSANNVHNHYFRTHFTMFNQDPTALTWAWNSLHDDGAILYVNGAELWRRNITNAMSAPVVCLDQASGHEADTLSSPNDAPRNLRVGNNVVAVHVKQNGSASGDIVWALQLDVTVSVFRPPRPTLCIFREDQSVRIVWPCPASSPPANGYVLQAADNLIGPWTTIPGASPYEVAPDGIQKFYRLCKP